MKTFNEIKIIGVDHGYGNIKTANPCFRTGITAYDLESLFTKDMLVYGGKTFRFRSSRQKRHRVMSAF